MGVFIARTSYPGMYINRVLGQGNNFPFYLGFCKCDSPEQAETKVFGLQSGYILGNIYNTIHSSCTLSSRKPFLFYFLIYIEKKKIFLIIFATKLIVGTR